MSDDLRISIEGSGPKRTCRLAGHLDTHTYLRADSELEPVLADPSVNLLVLDLSDLEYISSAGLRTVFRARKSLGSRGGKVLVANPQPQIRKVWAGLKKECCTTADTFAVFFPRGASARRKAGLLGLTFLLDFTIFERQGQEAA